MLLLNISRIIENPYKGKDYFRKIKRELYQISWILKKLNPQ